MANRREHGEQEQRPRRLSALEELDLQEDLREIEQEEEEIRRETAARRKRRRKQRELERRRRRKIKKLMTLGGIGLAALLVIILLIVLVSGAVKRSKAKRQKEAEALVVTSSSGTEETPVDPATLGSTVKLSAVGDNLISQRLIDQAKARGNGSNYDFSYAYASVAPFLKEHEINWIDVETCINDTIEPAGYPTFSTPGDDGKALLDAGFNVFSLANNHTYDLLALGIEAEVDYFSETMPENAVVTGLWPIGTAKKTSQSNINSGQSTEENVAGTSSVSSSDSENTASQNAAQVVYEYGDDGYVKQPSIDDSEIPIFTAASGKKIAFLTYSEMSNVREDALEDSMMVPEGSSHRIVFLYEREVIRDQIARADELADAVVVGCHWGVEDSHDITSTQREEAQFLADCGADLIIGAHSHVVQNIEWIDAKDGREVFCVYSLGNFVSTQESPDNLIGTILDCTLTFASDTEKASGAPEVTITDPKLVPIVTDYGEDGADAHVVLFSDYTEEQADAHGIHGIDSQAEFTLDSIKQTLKDALHDDYLAVDES